MRHVVFLLVVTVVLAGCGRREESAAPKSARPGAQNAEARPETGSSKTGTEVGSVMPEYAAMWLDGSTFDLAKHRNNVVLLNLWATWCGPCRFEIPELQKIHDTYKARGFEVIGVSVDESGVDAVKQFVAEHEMTYPVALDAEGKLATLLQTSMLPTSVLLDRSGRIVWKQAGAIMEGDEELKKAIEKSL